MITIIIKAKAAVDSIKATCQETHVAQQMHFTTLLVAVLILAGFLAACSSSPITPKDYGVSDEPVQQPEVIRPVQQKVVPKPQPQKESVYVAIRPDTPESYTVKRGDTLWDIASLFLKDPWLWPEIWYFNPQIDNPHLIYPGDIIALVYIDGKPVLQLARDGITDTVVKQTIQDEPSTPRGLKTIKLSPKIRRESLDSAIPTIPINLIQPFLVSPRIITEEELKKSPYIISSLDGHLVTAVNHTVYVRNLKTSDDVRYDVFRPGREFRDPKTGELLGIEALQVSEARLNKMGDPAILTLMKSSRETLNGDRILPSEKGSINYNFIPRAPKTEIKGQIIALVDAVSQTAKNQVVVINLGIHDGMEVGTVLAVDQKGATVRDNFSFKNYQEKVKLPDVRVGLIMVFRTFDRVSYALIMNSVRPIHLLDVVHNPAPVSDILAQ